MLTLPLVEEFLAAKEDAGRSNATLEQYRRILTLYAAAHPELPMTPKAVSEYIGTIQGQPETVHQVFRTLRTFYLWCVLQEYVDEGKNPMRRGKVEAPKLRPKVPRFLSLPQVRRVVECAIPPYNRALILALVDTGARIGELAGLTKDDLAGNSLRLAVGKTGQRVVPLSPEVAAYLREVPTHALFPKMGEGYGRGKGARGGLVVDEPCGAETLTIRVRRVLHSAGLTGRKLGPHVLRHTFGVLWIEAGGDLVSLARVLGHASIRMTEKYVSLATNQIAEKHHKFSPLNHLMSMSPATPSRDLPTVTLPEVPLLTPEGYLAKIVLAKNGKSGGWMLYSLRMGTTLEYRYVAYLGILPLNVVDAYRKALWDLNESRRREYADAQANTTAGH